MSNFFAFATKNSWDEDVFQLTTGGILTIVALIVFLIVAALFIHSRKGSHKLSTKQLVFSAVAMALGTVTSMIKLFHLPMGGSITLFSMLFIVLIGYWYGPEVGIMTSVAYGLLQFVIDPVFYSIPQLLVDYPLAFGALGLSGFFKGYIVGVLGRYVFAFLSGLLFFAAYAEGSGMSAPVYSLVYNGFYLIPEAIITLVIIAIPAVSKALQHIQQLARE